jgi:hypothetical protein
LLGLFSGCLSYPLADADTDHAEEKSEGVSYQRRYHFSESLESFLLCADRHDDIDSSADTAEKQDPTQYI